MPQEFQVLQCYSCKTFQVHQVKKAKKWACKMCGEKQSIIKVYGRGTGAECRQHVQSLNTHRGEIDMLKETFKHPEGLQGASHYTSDDCVTCYPENVQESENKWSQFVDNTSHVDDDDDGYDDRQYTTDASILDKKGKSRKRKRETPIYQDSEKSRRFNDFIDHQEDYDDSDGLHTSYPNTQGTRMTREHSKNDMSMYRASINYRQRDKNSSTDRDTTTKQHSQTEIHKYREENVGGQNQALDTGTGYSKWSSFGENYEQQENGDFINQLQACADASSQAKGGNSTLFLSNRNRVELAPLAFIGGVDDGNGHGDSNCAPTSSKTSKWSMYEEQSSQESSDNIEEWQIDSRMDVSSRVKGANSTLFLSNRNKVELYPLACKGGVDAGYKNVDPNSATMNYKTSKWSMYEEQSSQEACDNIEESQIGSRMDVSSQAKGGNSTFFQSNRNKVELYPLAFKEDLDDSYSHVDPNSATMNNESSKWSTYDNQCSQESSDNIEESQIDTRIYVDFNATLHYTQSDVADEISKYKNVSRNGKSQESIPKPTSSKWGQFVSVDAEDEGLGDLSNVFSHRNYNAPEPTSIWEKTAKRSENVENDEKKDLNKIHKEYLGDTNVPLKQKSESIVNRTVLREHSSQLNYGNTAYTNDAKDNGVKINKHFNKSSVVNNKQHDVKSLFTTGDLSDEDFEL